MLGPFLREIPGAIPSEICIIIPCAMSSSIPSTMLGAIPGTISSEFSCYFPSKNFGANVGTLSDVMLEFF